VGDILASQQIPQILQVLEAHRDKENGLYVTEETPGDDAVEHPFHFSSHVLLWHTCTRLATLLESFPDISSLQHSQLATQAELIKSATLMHFIGKHPTSGQTLFAYLTDGAGRHTFYHDANDIPTLFALDWNFLTTPTLHAIWSNTMDFGLSPLNDGGYYAEGKFGGLGSVHTKGPWPLGYAQEFIYAHLTGNESAKEDTWRRISGAMFWDGLFPEAVDCHTGDCVSKAWFSWPGSMIGSALLRFCVKPDSKTGI
jgi:meiotically up-regulated gene 157 (Mug157) protein